MSKKVEYAFEGTKLIVKIDPNEDGQALVKVELDISEIPDEVLSLMSAKK